MSVAAKSNLGAQQERLISELAHHHGAKSVESGECGTLRQEINRTRNTAASEQLGRSFARQLI